ncbi:MAG: LysM peptidoglycan-binding domain-containing protein [Planctomycetes bacterium]|nr:LysM peptidoglycan-binding domain-containing protein [Planctomycetota bacterium]
MRRGQTLSAICQSHYKTARPSVVDAVARHNKLSDPASLREGQRILLPPLDSLTQGQR